VGLHHGAPRFRPRTAACALIMRGPQANDPTRAQRISLAAQASRMRDMEQPAAPPSADSRIRRVDW
jgi:hypothetical protein